MKHKIISGIMILIVATVVSLNLNLVSKPTISNLTLSNVEALANENENEKKCQETSSPVYDKEMCSTNPVRHVIRSGTRYSCKKKDDGLIKECRNGFEGTIFNDCRGDKQTVTLEKKKC